jgi:hypothetical protein
MLAKKTDENQLKIPIKNYLAVAIIGSFMTLASVSHADYTYATLSQLSPSQPLPPVYYPTSFNDIGQAVGSYLDISGKYCGFIYDAGVFTKVAYPGANNYTFLTGINNSGQITGYYLNNDGLGRPQAFVYINNIFIPLDVPNAYTSGISNNGLVVGSFEGSQNELNGHFFIYNGSTYEVLPDVPNAITEYSYVQGINNSGEVVGNFPNKLTSGPGGTNGNGFLYKNGTYQVILFPNALISGVEGINDSGQILGEAFCAGCSSTSLYQIFVYDGSTYTALDLPGNYQNADIININTSGVLLGAEGGVNGDAFFFTATPSTLNSVCHPNVTYNFWSHELVIQDVLVSGVHYWAKLTDQGNYNFQLTDSHPFAAGTCPTSEVIQYANNSANIPSVLAYGKDYNITLVKDPNTGLYAMTTYSINPTTQ